MHCNWNHLVYCHTGDDQAISEAATDDGDGYGDKVGDGKVWYSAQWCRDDVMMVRELVKVIYNCLVWLPS